MRAEDRAGRSRRGRIAGGGAAGLLAAALLLTAPPLPAQEGSPTAGSGIAAPAAPVLPDRAPIDAFRDRIHRDVTEDGVGGITAAVVAGDRMIWAEGFGWADPERGIPAAVETIYRTGSISKPITAIVLAQLVEQGIVDLDDPAERHLPRVAELRDPPEGTEGVTLRRLATHTSGLIREPELDGAASGPIEEWEDKVLQSIPHTGFLDSPGAQVSYSNIGFGTLGLTLGRAAGRSFMELVEEGIFEPLGMRSSTFIVSPELEPYLAVGHVYRADEGTVSTDAPAREHRGRGYKVPNGGVYSTVGDLARIVAAMTGRAGETILSDEMRREMLRLQASDDGTSGFGLSWMVRETDAGEVLVGHSGSVAGYNAYMVFEAESGLGVILFRNYTGGTTNLRQAGDALLEELLAGAAAGSARE